MHNSSLPTYTEWRLKSIVISLFKNKVFGCHKMSYIYYSMNQWIHVNSHEINSSYLCTYLYYYHDDSSLSSLNTLNIPITYLRILLWINFRARLVLGIVTGGKCKRVETLPENVENLLVFCLSSAPPTTLSSVQAF